MTKVTALETAVIVNIVALGSSSVSVQHIHNGPEAVKQAQVNAVLLNLKGKGLVAREGDTVSLTEAGASVHAELFPAAKDLDTLRHESNLELNGPAKPLSAHELKLINELIELRTKARRLSAVLSDIQSELTPLSLSEVILKKFPNAVNVNMAHIEAIDLTGLPVGLVMVE